MSIAAMATPWNLPVGIIDGVRAWETAALLLIFASFIDSAPQWDADGKGAPKHRFFVG